MVVRRNGMINMLTQYAGTARGFLYTDNIVTREGQFASMLSASCLLMLGQPDCPFRVLIL